MANDYYTLIVVPHAKARFRKIQFSVRLAKWSAGVTAAVSVAVVALLCYYGRVAHEVFELRHLRSENQVLTARTKAYEENTSKLEAKVAQLQNMVTKLGVMAGLERALPDPSIGGVGGVTAAEAKAPSSLLDMDRNVSELTSKSHELEAFFRDQKVLLASTPSIWPARGYLSAAFGKRLDPFTGQPDFHPGLDISTPIGTPVHAPADGTVVSTGVQGGYGNALVVDHGYGIVTRYGHLSSFAVKPGQRVRRGEVIGFVGNTGRSTGPHVHYEVWVHDQAQNPIQYILDEFKSFG